ncbi:MAG: hypothetical protein N3D85_00725 [Candidatus Bathyarchaeota archaeon]|nr:hypothetical protein [Candidatus Bathyarchaeota archaeon]
MQTIIKRGKFLKLVTLLLSSLLIATASAAVYNLMYIDAEVAPKTAKVYFTTTGATDATAAGTTVGTGGTYVSFNSLSGWKNATRVYDKVVVIKNDNTATRNCTLRVNSTSGSVSDLDKLDFKVGSQTLDATTVNNSITFNISGNSSVDVEVRLKWKATAGNNPVTITLELIVDAEGDSE